MRIVTRKTICLLFALAAVIAALGILLPASWDVLADEPGVLVFTLVLSALHAAPFVVLAVLGAKLLPGRLSAVAGIISIVLVSVLLAWAYSVLDDDAQAGLVYVFFTPIAAWLIAGAALAAVLIQHRISRPVADVG